MVGASYGGGIQLVTAAIDHRVDAIVPTIAWNSPEHALYKNEALKSSWGAIARRFLDVHASPGRIRRSYPARSTAHLTGELSQADQDLSTSAVPTYLVTSITAPTLLIQGTVDTMFTLQEAHDNAMALIANGVQTKVVWFCGGHGGCISRAQRRRSDRPGDPGVARPAT